MWTQPRNVAHILEQHHYLGASRRGIAWQDRFGVIIVAQPTARHIPAGWLEIVRWCITSREKNAGSQQFAAFIRGFRQARPDITTLVSYSDPSAGHTGALYRACNWWWAPTWHRLRPPPSGNGSWSAGKRESVKDRWIFAVRRDYERIAAMRARDDSIIRRFPWLEYSEPGGVSFKRFIAELQ